jgi:hypothetical protein
MLMEHLAGPSLSAPGPHGLIFYHESNPIKEEDFVYPPPFSDLFWTKYPALRRI